MLTTRPITSTEPGVDLCRPARARVWSDAGVIRTELHSGALALRRLHAPGGRVRIGIIAAQALLLAGDAVRLDIEVDSARVEFVEPAGTVAYQMRGGQASWRVDARVFGSAQVTWSAAPFVLAEGARVDREFTAEVDQGARLAWREQYSFGRTGEAPGWLRSRTRVALAGAPALHEDLDLGPASLDSWGGLLGARQLDMWSVVGERWERPDALQWETCGSTVRWWGAELHSSPFDASEPRSRRE